MSGHIATSLQHLDEHKVMSHIPICTYKCDYCDFKSKKKWHTIRHQELNCSVHKKKLIQVLTDEEVLKLFSDCNITKFDFNKICFLKADISFLCVMIDLPLWSVSGVTSQYLVGPAALPVRRCVIKMKCLQPLIKLCGNELDFQFIKLISTNKYIHTYFYGKLLYPSRNVLI